jgi:phospholipid-translocating ATPase
MPEGKGDVLEYQAQSPDEAALTSAARNFGYVFRKRTPQSITLEVDGHTEVIYMVLPMFLPAY